MSGLAISTPLIAPPQQFTNVRTLINGQGNAVKVLLFLNTRPIDIGPPTIPGGSLPGTSFPGFAPIFARYGRFLTEGQDYSIDGGIVTMMTPPTAMEILTAVVFSIGVALGGRTPTRYVAPWHLPFALVGPYDGVGTTYYVVLGPTIFGTVDGANATFTFGVQLQKVSVFRNGILQTVGTDVVTGPTSIRFLPRSIPKEFDLITMTGWL